MTALDGDGRMLATSVAEGQSERAFDADYLATVATCLERAGVEVVRTPQGHGSGPGYEFDLSSLPAERAEQLQDRCEAQAEATPPP